MSVLVGYGAEVRKEVFILELNFNATSIQTQRKNVTFFFIIFISLDECVYITIVITVHIYVFVRF